MEPVTIHNLFVIAAPEPQSPRIIRICREIAEQSGNPGSRFRLSAMTKLLIRYVTGFELKQETIEPSVFIHTTGYYEF